jgi:hypothetical protein
MANIVIWGALGLMTGWLADRILRAANLRLNLTAGVGICIAAGLVLAPLTHLDPTLFTMALAGLVAGLTVLSLLTPEPAGD